MRHVRCFKPRDIWSLRCRGRRGRCLRHTDETALDWKCEESDYNHTHALRVCSITLPVSSQSFIRPTSTILVDVCSVVLRVVSNVIELDVRHLECRSVHGTVCVVLSDLVRAVTSSWRQRGCCVRTQRVTPAICYGRSSTCSAVRVCNEHQRVVDCHIDLR